MLSALPRDHYSREVAHMLAERFPKVAKLRVLVSRYFLDAKAGLEATLLRIDKELAASHCRKEQYKDEMNHCAQLIRQEDDAIALLSQEKARNQELAERLSKLEV